MISSQSSHDYKANRPHMMLVVIKTSSVSVVSSFPGTPHEGCKGPANECVSIENVLKCNITDVLCFVY
jgi:hypothetical protein